MSPITDTKTLTQSLETETSKWISVGKFYGSKCMNQVWFLPVENRARRFELVEAHPILRDIQNLNKDIKK